VRRLKHGEHDGDDGRDAEHTCRDDRLAGLVPRDLLRLGRGLVVEVVGHGASIVA
jgi:hypothetical protein